MRAKQVAPLSEYPSEAIRQTVADIKWVEKRPDIEVDMDTWGGDLNTCSVCQAGATAMRRSNWDNTTLPNFSKDRLLDTQITAFDDLRRGDLDMFLKQWTTMTLDQRSKFDDEVWVELKPWVAYKTDPAKYKRNLLKIADMLEEEGY